MATDLRGTPNVPACELVLQVTRISYQSIQRIVIEALRNSKLREESYQTGKGSLNT